jgi:hypothetical protein
MSAIDEILAAVQASQKLDAATKTLVTSFLQAGGGAVAGLAPAVVRDLLAGLAGSGSADATAAPAAEMTGPQLAAAVSGAGEEMAALADERAKSAAASRAVIAALGEAALAVLAKAVVAAL